MQRSLSYLLFSLSLLLLTTLPDLARGADATGIADSTFKKVQFEKNFSVSSKHSLQIFLHTQAALSIEGWNKNEVAVKVDMEGQALEVNCNQEGEIIFINSRFETITSLYPSRRSIHIKVPLTMIMRASLTEGDITLANLQGETFLETRKGNIKGENIGGKVFLSTQEGFLQLTGGVATGSLTAHQGSITLTNVKGQLDASSFAGHFSIQSLKQSFDASIEGNAVNLAVKEGNVQASVYKGILNVQWLSTSSIKNGKINLSAHEGDLVLRLPDGIGMDISIEQVQSQHVTTVGSITMPSLESEFDLGFLPLGKEFTHQGKKNHLKQVQKTVAGGGNQVQIFAVDSKISLQKSR